ncbi:15075_t:CDS:2, partial [Acaulospora colombiana]
MSICLTCPKPSAHSHLPELIMSSEDKQTALIFIMKTKSRSRAVDWIWRLWRTLGGTIPESIEIRCPVLEARVNFPIPAVDPVSGVEGYRIFTRDNVIQNCREQMSGIPEWDLLIESILRQGSGKEPARLELCWRTDSKLDWAWLQEDVNGLSRPWSVLFGLAINN